MTADANKFLHIYYVKVKDYLHNLEQAEYHFLYIFFSMTSYEGGLEVYPKLPQ